MAVRGYDPSGFVAIKATLDQVNLVELRQEVNDMKKRLEELEAKAR